MNPHLPVIFVFSAVIIAAIGIAVTVSAYASCDGTVVRDIWGTPYCMETGR